MIDNIFMLLKQREMGKKVSFQACNQIKSDQEDNGLQNGTELQEIWGQQYLQLLSVNREEAEKCKAKYENILQKLDIFG